MPSDPRQVSTWIAETIDGDRKRQPRRGWKDELVGNRSVHRLMADIPRDTQYHFRVSTEEAIVVSRALARVRLSRNAFMRRALAYWLITHEGVDPETIPRLVQDL